MVLHPTGLAAALGPSLPVGFAGLLKVVRPRLRSPIVHSAPPGLLVLLPLIKSTCLLEHLAPVSGPLPALTFIANAGDMVLIICEKSGQWGSHKWVCNEGACRPCWGDRQ